jgi:uncharacterized membrane protein
MEPVSGILFSLYRGTQHHGEWIVACLEGAWPGIMGERLAKVCRPLAFKDFDLVVEITDAAWERALRSVKKNIAEKLRAATSGEVRSITLKRIQ